MTKLAHNRKIFLVTTIVILGVAGIAFGLRDLNKSQIDDETNLTSAPITSTTRGIAVLRSATDTNSTHNTLSVNALENMAIDTVDGVQHLKDGSYLSAIIDCQGIRSTCPYGERQYLALDLNTIHLGNFNGNGVSDAIVGIRGGYVNGADDLAQAAAENEALGESLDLVVPVNGQLMIAASIYGTDVPYDYRWDKINNVSIQGSYIVIDATEEVNYDDSTGIHAVRRIYTLMVNQNQFSIVRVVNYFSG